MNRQPWDFAVLDNAERIAAYGERGRQWLLQNLTGHAEAAELSRLLLAPGTNSFTELLCSSSFSPHRTDSKPPRTAASPRKNFMLAACDEGLGTCWIGLSRPWLNLPEIKAELKICENHHVMAPIILGYPAGTPEMHERNPVEIHWIE
jgi:nitroreductase